METVKNSINSSTKSNSLLDMISMPSIKSIKSSVQSVNPLREKSTTEKISETLQSVNPLSEKSNSQDIMNKFPISSENIYIPSIKPQSTWQSWIIRIILLFIILALLGINLWAYLVKGTDLFSGKLRDVVSTGGNSFFDTIQTAFDNTAQGTRFSTGIVADSFKSLINVLKGVFTSVKKGESITLKQETPITNKKSKLSKVLNKENKKEDAKPDMTESEIQKKNAGFCYIGHQTPHNACVKIDDTKKCMSGKFFKSMDECRNYKPN
jgi:hypothetical protein